MRPRNLPVLRALLGAGWLLAACAREAPPATPPSPRVSVAPPKAAPGPVSGRTDAPRPPSTSPPQDGGAPPRGPSCEGWANRRALSREAGKASYYSDALAGRSTASGRPYRPEEFTAAHKSLPFGSTIRVSSRKTGKRTCAVVTDRGPFVRGRIVDLSRSAAEELGLVRLGVADVEVEVLELPPPTPKKKPKKKPKKRR